MRLYERCLLQVQAGLSIPQFHREINLHGMQSVDDEFSFRLLGGAPPGKRKRQLVRWR